MRKAGRLRRVAELIDVPPEALLNVTRVEVIGQIQVRVENHRGIVAFRPSQVTVRVPEGRLIIDGQDLVIGWVDQGDILVSGRVNGVRFEGDQAR